MLQIMKSKQSQVNTLHHLGCRFWKVLVATHSHGQFFNILVKHVKVSSYPSKIEWDLTNGPLSKLLELLDTQV